MTVDLVSRLYLAAMHFNEDAERHKDRSSEVTAEPQQSEPKPSEYSSHTHTEERLNSPTLLRPVWFTVTSMSSRICERADEAPV